MSHKTLLMGDTEFAERIAEVDTPAKAKQLGREVRKFQQRIWNGNCDRVVEEGNYAKFEQNGKLKVVSVGLWGIGFSSDDAVGNEHTIGKWGENKLGKALERISERLRKDTA